MIPSTKKQLRKYIKDIIDSINDEERFELSKDATLRLVSSKEWRNARHILLFASLPDEIDTSLLIQYGLKEGKQLYLPRVNGDMLDICVYSTSTLEIGAYNILEPNSEAIVLNNWDLLDLIIVPGRAFTLNGDRLGRGKSFYDRFLPLTRAYKVGFAYPQQIVETIPTDEWDVVLDIICTAKLHP